MSEQIVFSARFVSRLSRWNVRGWRYYCWCTVSTTARGASSVELDAPSDNSSMRVWSQSVKSGNRSSHASGLPEHSPGCHQCVIPLVQQSERDFPSCFQSFVHLSDGMERFLLFIHRNVHFHGTIFLAMIPPVSLPKTGVQWTCPNRYQIPKIHPTNELSRWHSVGRSVLQIPKSFIFAMVSSRSYSACAVTHELLNDWVKDFVELGKGAVTDSVACPVQSWDWTTGLHARTWAKCFGWKQRCRCQKCWGYTIRMHKRHQGSRSVQDSEQGSDQKAAQRFHINTTKIRQESTIISLLFLCSLQE